MRKTNFMLILVEHDNSFIFLSSGCIPPKKVSCNNDKLCKDSINGICILIFLYRGYYMSAHVLLNLLNELGKRV